jgi:hypothetical protein
MFPQSPAATAALSVASRFYSPALLNHCVRSYLWGAMYGAAHYIAFDDELYYVSALLHDIGPTDAFDSHRLPSRRREGTWRGETWVNAAGNLVALIRGDSDSDGERVTRVMAHMDELSMLVKRVEPDETLHLAPLGTMLPGQLRIGTRRDPGPPRDVDRCAHAGIRAHHQGKPSIWETKPDQGDKSLDWMRVYVFTGRTPQELAAAGVGPGTRVCVDRSKRSVVEVGDYLGSYFMDDRAAVTVLLETARRLRMSGSPPARDVYLVLTTNEEVGGVGCTAIVPRVIHVSIVSPLVSDVRRIAVPSLIRSFDTLVCRLFRDGRGGIERNRS